MPYVFKTNDLDDYPSAGGVRELTSRRSHVSGDLQCGERIYVFVDDNGALGRYGKLVGRGLLETAQRSGPEHTLGIRFDGVDCAIPLETRHLHRFAHPDRYDLPEAREAPIQEMFEVLRELGKIRGNTIKQPIHSVSDSAANWLDLYHFEKEKI